MTLPSLSPRVPSVPGTFAPAPTKTTVPAPAGSTGPAPTGISVPPPGKASTPASGASPIINPSATTSAVNCDATQQQPLVAAPPVLTAVPQFDAPASALTVPKVPADVTILSTTPLTLAQTVELARSRSRNLQISALQVTQQQQALRQVRASLYPVVSAQAGLTRTDSAQSAITARRFGVARPAPTNNFSGGPSVNYDIYTSGQRTASIRAAEAAVRSAEQSYRTQFRQVQLDTASAYFDLQQARELIRIARQSVSSAEENVRVTRATEAAGVGTRFDVLQAEVSLSNFRQQLIQAQSQQQIAQRNIAQLLSLPPTATITAADSIGLVGEWSPTLEASIVTALQNRSELAQVLEQRQIAQQNRRLALGSLGPQVSASGSFNYANTFSDSQLTNFDAGGFGYGLGAQVSKTIFDGGAAKAIAAQQQTNAAIAETQFASYKNIIRFQVEQNYYSLLSSRDQILTTRCAVEQARQGLELAKIRRNFGVGTSLDVSNAETALAQAENNYLQAIVSYNRSLIALQRFVGQPRL